MGRIPYIFLTASSGFLSSHILFTRTLSKG